jgi:hypothetical protein
MLCRCSEYQCCTAQWECTRSGHLVLSCVSSIMPRHMSSNVYIHTYTRKRNGIYARHGNHAPSNFAYMRTHRETRKGAGPDSHISSFTRVLDMCDGLSKHFVGTAPKLLAPNVLRILLDMRYTPDKNKLVRSRIISFFRLHRALSGGILKCLRVSMGYTRDCNTDWDATELRLAVSLPKGTETKDACLAVVQDFHNMSTPFAGSSRTAYAVRDIVLLMPSCFISLVFAPLPRGKGDALLAFTARWRRVIEGDDDELLRQWECQVRAKHMVLVPKICSLCKSNGHKLL